MQPFPEPAMVATPFPHVVTWQKLPDDFPLPDDPVDNMAQPAIAAALTESLRIANRLPPDAFTCTNYGLCATLNGKMVVKAPDWAYVPRLTVARDEINRSYTPQLQGDVPAIVLEFLSETEGPAYSIKSTYPPGKFFFYEQILHVPNYGIFDPKTGVLELYRQGNHAAPYRLQPPDSQGRVWIPELDLIPGAMARDVGKPPGPLAALVGCGGQFAPLGAGAGCPGGTTGRTETGTG